VERGTMGTETCACRESETLVSGGRYTGDTKTSPHSSEMATGPHGNVTNFMGRGETACQGIVICLHLINFVSFKVKLIL
jgi:hypothetical protein